MNELMVRVFENEEFGNVRMIVENGEVLFCGTDVARALKYARPLNAISQHCPHSLKRGVGVQTGVKADGTPAMQTVEMIFIPEGDVYRLVVHSRLETAVRFERWVFDEVLPTLRKTGSTPCSRKITRAPCAPWRTQLRNACVWRPRSRKIAPR